MIEIKELTSDQKEFFTKAGVVSDYGYKNIVGRSIAFSNGDKEYYGLITAVVHKEQSVYIACNIMPDLRNHILGVCIRPAGNRILSVIGDCAAALYRDYTTISII